MRAVIFIIFALQISRVFAAEEHGIGRLFTTQAERQRLDAIRKTASIAAMQAQEAKATREDVEVDDLLPEKVSMQGFVKRSDGRKSTLWINHQAMQESTSNDDIQVGNFNKNEGRKNSSINFKLKKSGQTFNLKPGQVYLPNDTRIVDLGKVHRAAE